MLAYNELKPGTFIIFESQPYEVLEFAFFKNATKKTANKTKLKNLITGK